jgi:uncharacterized protein (DUF2249 family)
MLKDSAPVEVFFSYAREDEALINEFKKFLVDLERREMIKSWHDRQIAPGKQWSKEIETYLRRADIILLFISANFHASDFCNVVELQHALERAEDGTARVIPVILRPCLWEDTPIGIFQALPTNGKAVTTWRNRAEAFTDVARGIRDVVSNIPRPSRGGRSPNVESPQTSPSASAIAAQQKLDKEVDVPDASTKDEVLPFDYYFLNHTSFLRREKQEEFQRRTGVPLDHYDIRVVVDSYYKGALDRIERVEYQLHDSDPKPVRVLTASDRPQKFLLKELCNGEYVLQAEVFLKDRNKPIALERYITLSETGPRLRF